MHHNSRLHCCGQSLILHEVVSFAQDEAIRLYKADTLVVGAPKPTPSSSEGTEEEGEQDCSDCKGYMPSAMSTQRRPTASVQRLSMMGCVCWCAVADDDLDTADQDYDDDDEEVEEEEQ